MKEPRITTRVYENSRPKERAGREDALANYFKAHKHKHRRALGMLGHPEERTED